MSETKKVLDKIRDQDNRKKLFQEALKYTCNLVPSSPEFHNAPLIKLHHDELKQNKAELKRKIKEIMSTDSEDKKKRLTNLIMQYYAPKVSMLYGLNQLTTYKLMENQKDRSGNLFIDNLVESSLKYLESLDNYIGNQFKTNTKVTDYKDIKPDKLEDTLSKYGWKYDKTTSVRHTCLVRSLEKYKLDRVNRALLFVGRTHKAQPDVVSACNEDLKWIEENWDKGKNIEKKIEIIKRKREEKLKEEKKLSTTKNKNPQKRKINPPSPKSKKNIDRIPVMKNPNTITRFFNNYNKNEPCKVKMRAIDFIEYSSSHDFKDMYPKDESDKKRIIEEFISQSKIKNAIYINENGEDYIVIIQ